jgi:Archaeal ATPase.
VRRVELELAPGLVVEFADRARALGQVEEFAEEGTRWPFVVFGPEGCGKTAFLRQAASGLRELGYDVFYLHPLDRVFSAEVDDPDVKTLFLDLVRRTLEDEKWGRLAMAVFDLVREILKKRRRKIAVLADDVFQAIGLDKAAAYVKGLLNTIEHPVYRYENIVVLVATSEGISRREIGIHRWAELMFMWNMPKEGFQQLYEKLPGPKPSLDDVWRWTGGNPYMLRELYVKRWDVDKVVKGVVGTKELTADFARRWGKWLMEAGDDPEALWGRGAPQNCWTNLSKKT